MLKKTILTFLVLIISVIQDGNLTAQEVVTLKAVDKNKFECYFQPGKHKVAVLLISGMFSNGDWNTLRLALSEKEIASLSLEYTRSNYGVNHAQDIQVALGYLKKHGYKEFVLIAEGWRGNNGLVEYMGKKKIDKLKALILINPKAIKTIDNKQLKKIFIIPNDSSHFENAKELFALTKEPKQWHEFSGGDDVNDLFNEKNKRSANELIINIISNE
jgi:hypothetical protein